MNDTTEGMHKAATSLFATYEAQITKQAADLKLASQEWCSVNALLKGAEARALEHRSRAELADRQLTMAVNTLREISTSSASKAIRDKARRALEKLENVK